MKRRGRRPKWRRGASSGYKRGMSNPFILDVQDILGQQGGPEHVHTTGETPHNLGGEMFGIAPGTSVDIDLILTNLGEAIMAQGTVSGPASVECGRCLRRFTTDLSIKVDQVFGTSSDFITTEDEDSDEEGDDLPPLVEDDRVALPKPGSTPRSTPSVLITASSARPTSQSRTAFRRKKRKRRRSTRAGPACPLLNPASPGVTMARKRRLTGEAALRAAYSKHDHTPLLQAWGIELSDEMLRLALTHRSFAHENDNVPNNERLEFLGDAVLGLSVAEQLYTQFPQRSESDISKMRAGVVNMYALAGLARSLGLGEYILLGRGEMKTDGRTRTRSSRTPSRQSSARSTWSTASRLR